MNWTVIGATMAALAMTGTTALAQGYGGGANKRAYERMMNGGSMEQQQQQIQQQQDAYGQGNAPSAYTQTGSGGTMPSGEVHDWRDSHDHDHDVKLEGDDEKRAEALYNAEVGQSDQSAFGGKRVFYSHEATTR